MTKKEFRKGINEYRKLIGKRFGFKRSGYISYKVVDNYFFYILHLVATQITLDVKPLYIDDLWWDIFLMPDNKKQPLSHRGKGAFALSGEQLGVYPTFVDSWENYSEQDFEKVWIDVFEKVEEKIKNFLSQNPSADLFMPHAPNPTYIPLPYLIALLHNHKYEEVIELVHKAREIKSPCSYARWDDGVEKDSYSYILDYAMSHLKEVSNKD